MGRLGRFLVVLGILVALLVGVEFGIRALVGSQLQEALTSTDLELEQPSVELGGLGGILAWYSLIHTDPDRLDPLLAEFARAVRPGGGLAIGFFEGPALVPFGRPAVRTRRASRFHSDRHRYAHRSRNPPAGHDPRPADRLRRPSRRRQRSESSTGASASRSGVRSSSPLVVSSSPISMPMISLRARATAAACRSARPRPPGTW